MVDRHREAGADRLLVMKAIFDAPQGSENVYVSSPELLDAIELTDQELGDACDTRQFYRAGAVGLQAIVMPRAGEA